MSAADIIDENALPGSPESEWGIAGTGTGNIEGFAAQMSVDQGQTVEFKVNTDTADYRLDIYRMGWYGGLGARHVATVDPLSNQTQNQPNPLFDSQTNLVDAGNWGVSARWDVPIDAVSGVYIAKLVREDLFGENHIIFVVRDDDGKSEMLFQTSDTTWQAYNNWGGYSFYKPNTGARARAVSYNRPFNTRDANPIDYYFGAEFAMTRFLERNGYDVSYTTGIDTDWRGEELLEHNAFISVGHDEYWSGPQRANVEAARDAGVNLAFFSGNEVYWKTRWEDTIDGSDTPYRTMVSYKETWDDAKTDPLADVWTGTWRDPRFSPPADGGRPENALTGTMFTVNRISKVGPFDATNMVVSADYAPLRFWRNTDIATLTGNQSLAVGDNVLGYEFDEDLDNGFRPAGLIPLSSTTLNVVEKLYDYGSTVGPGTATHGMTLYRTDSGAMVFGAGTIQYAWGLDSGHDGVAATTDRNLQQATVNLFADMGMQPGSLMAGLVPATASSDSQAPVSIITSPASGAVLQPGVAATISGTAQDQGGGVVAVVEVSVDGGLTWHRATGRENWTYTYTPRGSGEFTIASRAVDDNGNIESASPRVTVNPTPTPGIYSLWTGSGSPSTVDIGEGDALELGFRFTADTDALITGVRFYKSAANTGRHTGSLWTSSGQLLAAATFTNETSSGWQQVDFANPVAITAGTTYVASYYAPNGHYSVDRDYFATLGISSGPLHALADGPAGGNGVFRYGNTSAFPSQTYQASNYWVDVVLSTAPSTDITVPTVTSISPANGTSNVATNVAAVVTFSEALNSSTVNTSTISLRDVTGAVVSSTVVYNASTNSATLIPTNTLATSSTYKLVVQGGSGGVKDLAGNALLANATSSFSTADAPTTVTSNLWSRSETPAIIDAGDPNEVELGIEFTSSTDGFITGLWFYKSAANTGTHAANLWTANGQLLATATFTNETASGWQQVDFANPVAVTAGTTYVASYHTNSGRYSVNQDYFDSSFTNGPLTVSANGGVYAYGGGGFPSNTYQGSNYWIDVAFTSVGTDPALTAAAVDQAISLGDESAEAEVDLAPRVELLSLGETAGATESPDPLLLEPAGVDSLLSTGSEEEASDEDPFHRLLPAL